MAIELIRILCVDDSEVQLLEVTRALTPQGHIVLTAGSVRDAQTKVAEADLVMIDFHMPETDGAETLRILRRYVRKDMPVLFYLFTTDNEVALSFKSHGFDGAFVSKGDAKSLIVQVEAAHRMLQLKRFRHERLKA